MFGQRFLLYISNNVQLNTIADPGFSWGMGANPPGGAPKYDFVNFAQKLHEIERIWTPGDRMKHACENIRVFLS